MSTRPPSSPSSTDAEIRAACLELAAEKHHQPPRPNRVHELELEAAFRRLRRAVLLKQLGELCR